MKVLDTVKLIIGIVIAVLVITMGLLFCIFCIMALFDLITYLLVLAGMPIKENMYVLDDLLEIFEETFSR